MLHIDEGTMTSLLYCCTCCFYGSPLTLKLTGYHKNIIILVVIELIGRKLIYIYLLYIFGGSLYVEEPNSI